ncbi:hypothetical protein AN901_200046 [Pseudomonas syringae pv. theae]|nr:hypothetical protein AN901_200046 [Pseudomonas syringae pv. theae]
MLAEPAVLEALRGWVERNVALSNIEELKIRHVVTSNPAIERPADLGKFSAATG